MRKKTVEVPQVQYTDKIVAVQFKVMDPWRYRGNSKVADCPEDCGDASSVVDVPVIREQQVPTIQKNRLLFKYHVDVVDEIFQVL